MLIAAHAVKQVETSCVSLERYGLARSFRRGNENQEFEMREYSDYSAYNRFVASQCDLPFWPCDYLGGSDIPTYNKDIKEYKCPVSGKHMYAIPPANPDFAIIHSAAADPYGNVLMPQRMLFPQADDILFARASKNVIVTVERIISNSLVRKFTNMVMLHKHKVKAVVLAPYGAHPCSFPQFYNVDDQHFKTYVEASRTQEGMEVYLEKYVRKPEDQYAYLDMMGSKQLSAINLPTFI
jgi:glutaconate CoA-transferase subunit A